MSLVRECCYEIVYDDDDCKQNDDMDQDYDPTTDHKAFDVDIDVKSTRLDDICMKIKILGLWIKANMPLTKIAEYLNLENILKRNGSKEASDIWGDKKIRNFCEFKLERLINLLLGIKHC